MIVVFWKQQTWISSRAPTQSIYASVMPCKWSSLPFIIFGSYYKVNHSISWSSSQSQSIFPWCPLDWIHACCSLKNLNFLPLIYFDFFPNFYLSIVSTCRKNIFVFRMSPCYCPAWSSMSLKFSSYLLVNCIVFHSPNLYNPIRIASSHSCAIVIKLWIILK